MVALEEGCAPGGFTSAVAELLADENIRGPCCAAPCPTTWSSTATPARLLDEQGLSPEALRRRILAFAAE